MVLGIISRTLQYIMDAQRPPWASYDLAEVDEVLDPERFVTDLRNKKRESRDRAVRLCLAHRAMH